MTTTFQDFGLKANLLQALRELEHKVPTPVQQEVIPLLLEGRDVIAQARTGTGKTAAFALPALQDLTGSKGVQVLVLSPTRELAIQVGQAFQDYGRHEHVRVLTIYGGASYGHQKGTLRDGVSVVVGTPGRLLDLIRQGALKLEEVRFLVLDEADEMLSMGFQEEVEEVISHLPKKRKTALFSATMPQAMQGLAAKATHKPESVNLSRQISTDNVELACFVVKETDKVAAVTRIFEVEDVQTCLVFCRTRAQTATMAAELTRRGIPAEALSGALEQDTRERVLGRFRDQVFNVLVATDVAARGLDIDHLSHVINMDLPQSPDTFVHRIGRTARAGRKGTAYTLVTPNQQWKLRRVERALKRSIEVRAVPSRKEIMRGRLEKLYANLDKWLGHHRCKKELAWVEEMIVAGHDPKDIAAAALKLAAASEKQVPIADMSDENLHMEKKKSAAKKKKKTTPGNNMVQLMANVGKKHSLKPKELVRLLSRHAKIPNKLIGSIRITKTRTFVELPGNCVPQVVAANGKYRLGNYPVIFTVD